MTGSIPSAANQPQSIPNRYPTQQLVLRHPILGSHPLEIDFSDIYFRDDRFAYLGAVAIDGTVEPPFMGKPFHVAGLDDCEAGAALQEEYWKWSINSAARILVRRLRVAGTGGPPPQGPIGAFDLVRVESGDLGGPGETLILVGRVDAAGDYAIPYSSSVHLAGLTDRAAQAAIVKSFREQNVVNKAQVAVLRLEAAPSDAGRVDLPDGPIYPVPEDLRWIYQPTSAGPPELRMR